MATYTWNNAAGGAWTLNTNWVGNQVPPNGSDINISTLNITSNTAISSVPTGLIVNSITASDTAAATVYNYWSLNGGSLATPLNITTPYLQNDPVTNTAGNISLSISATTDITGSGDLNKYGAGILDVDVNGTSITQKTFTGNVNIYDGYISTGDSNVFKGQINIYKNTAGLAAYTGTGGTVFGNTINVYGEGFILGLDSTADDATTISGPINLYKQNNNIYFGSGDVRTISGIITEITASTNISLTGSVSLTGNNKHTGNTSISQGNLSLGINSVQSSSLVWNTIGTFTAPTSTILGGLSGSSDITCSNPIFIGNMNKNETFKGSMGGAGAVTKIGTGEWYNYNNNTYGSRTGLTTVSNGALRIGFDDTLGQTTTGGLTISNNGAVKFDTGTPPSKSWSIGGSPSYYGNAHIIFLDNTTVSSSMILTSDVVLTASNGLTLSGSSNITSAGYNLSLSSGSYTVNKILALGVGGVNSSGSNISLGAVNTFTGYYGNDGGVTTLTNASALSTATVDQISGTIGFSGISTATIGGIYNSSANINTAGLTTLTIGTAAASNGEYTGIISSTGGVTKTGANTLTLRNSNTYSGPTVVSAGALKLAHKNALTATTSVTVNSGQTLQVAPIEAGGNITLPSATTFNGGNFIIA